MKSRFDFSPLHNAMQRYVDESVLPGISSAVLVGRDLVDIHCAGLADIEQRVTLRADHLFRIYSNTKLVTSIAVLLLFEEGKFDLDNPIELFIPQLGKRRVLRPGALSLDDTEAANNSITIRHLLCHSSGLSYGLFEPNTLIFKAYRAKKILSPWTTLAEKVNMLAELPLGFHPGTDWEYSIATDVLSRLVEVVSGQPFDAYIKSRIFDPLGMTDTGFVIPESQQSRLATMYTVVDTLNLNKPKLMRNDKLLLPNANLQPVAFLSGGAGLVSSLPDMVKLISSLMPNGEAMLKPQTINLMMRNQLPSGMGIKSSTLGSLSGKGFGLGGAVTLASSAIDSLDSVGDFEWGGLAGTHWWISPKKNLAAIVMTQRWHSFWHPFSFDLKRLIYQAVS